MIQLALSSTERLIRLVNDILDLEKTETQKLAFEMQLLRPGELIAAATDAVSGLSKETGVAVAVEGMEHGVINTLFIGDLDRLVQLLVNLIGNALKFTERGEVVLDVRCGGRTDTTVCLYFSVRDTGIGIPTDKLDRLFKPFTQVDASTTRHFGGTGLGLAIVRHVIQNHGGEIEVEFDQGDYLWSARTPRLENGRAVSHGALGRRGGDFLDMGNPGGGFDDQLERDPFLAALGGFDGGHKRVDGIDIRRAAHLGDHDLVEARPGLFEQVDHRREGLARLPCLERFRLHLGVDPGQEVLVGPIAQLDVEVIREPEPAPVQRPVEGNDETRDKGGVLVEEFLHPESQLLHLFCIRGRPVGLDHGVKLRIGQ